MTTKVGLSKKVPSGEVGLDGEDMVEEAREDGGLDDEDFGILFTSTDFDFRELVSGLDEEIDSEWVGGTTVAEISPESSRSESAVLMLVESDEISFKALRSTKVSEGAEEAAKKAVESVSQSFRDDRNSLLYTLVPGFTIERDGREFEFLKGLEKKLQKDIKIAGGSTGDSHRLRENYQLINGDVHADKAVMALIQTENQIVTRQRHGFDDSISTGIVTEAEGRLVKEIGNRPAVKFYAEAVDEDVSDLDRIYDAKWSEKISAGLYYLYLKLKGEDPNMFDEVLHYSLEHAIGHQMRPGEYRIISPLEIVDEGIKLMDEIPEGQTIEILETDKQSVIKAGKEAFSDVEKNNVLFGVVNDCANRHMILDRDERNREIEGLTEEIGEKFIGFYGEGEIGDPGNGICTFMNQTLTGFVVMGE